MTRSMNQTAAAPSAAAAAAAFAMNEDLDDDADSFPFSELCDPMATFATVSVEYQAVRAVAGLALASAGSPADVFEECLHLKRALDELESSEEQADEDQSLLAAKLGEMLNGEFLLYSLSSAPSTPLRLNPFLSHWVEVIQAWEGKIASLPLSQQQQQQQAGAKFSWEDMHRARLEFVKIILLDPDPQLLATFSATSILSKAKTHPVSDFAIEPFIQMLEDEGVYEKEEAAAVAAVAAAAKADHAGDNNDEEDDEAAALLAQLAGPGDRAEHVLSRIAHLPIDIPSLELINSLLASGALLRLTDDPTAVVRSYVQHGLRDIETALSGGGGGGINSNGNGTSPGESEPSAMSVVSASSSSSAPDDGGSASSSTASSSQLSSSGAVFGSATSPPPGGQPPPPTETTATADRSREAQARAIKLLVLFLQNLLRKRAVDPHQIYYEIQEICVRYLWVREVRELRAVFQDDRWS